MNTNKQRVNIMLSPDARKMLKSLAAFEKRSRSNFIEVLIRRENQRTTALFATAQPIPAKA